MERRAYPATTLPPVRHARRSRAGWAALGAVLLTAALLAAGAAGAPTAPPTAAASDPIQKIKHVVMIMQENRSFDSYFGTYPGADGIPTDRNGNFKVCV